MPGPRHHRWNLVLVAALVACAPDRPVQQETEGRPVHDGAWAALGGQLVSVGGALELRVDTGVQHLATELVGAPAISGDGQRVALSRRGAGEALCIVELLERGPEGAVQRRVLDGEGAPDRVAISPDGDHVAWVDAGPEGFASVFVVSVAGGAPVQLTNVGVQASPGRAPAGFVPPPVDGPLRFEGAALVWSTSEGPQRRRLP